MEYYACYRREAADPSSALNFGKIIHKCLEFHYTNLFYHRPTNLSDLLSIADKGFTESPPPEGEYRTYGLAVSLLTEYLTQYPFESFNILALPDGKPAIEVPFALPIGEIEINREILVRDPSTLEVKLTHVPSIKIVWTGRIDLLYTVNDSLYILDHKTTSQLGPTYFKAFELSSQVYGYRYSIAKLLDRHVNGFCVNAMCARRPTRTGTGLELSRNIVPLDETIGEEWLDDTLSHVSSFINSCIVGYFPKSPQWCFGKFGECSYRTVCSMPPAQREIILMGGLYKTVDWSPLNKDSE